MTNVTPLHSRQSAAPAATLRRRMETAIERLIAALDALDAPTMDLEDGGELEEEHDREHDEAELSGIGDADGLDEQRDGEPWLGATIECDQRIASAPTRGFLASDSR